MTRYKLLNGERVAYTEVEEAQADKDEKKWDDEKSARELNDLRIERNDLLAETDWMGNSDLTMSDDWKTYRQQLRDITKTYTSMSDDGFSFPNKPKE
tara:strand:- start:105 stop:395 length:291 start_codon:yes stop_codon:yes gene_type:complete